MATNTNLDDVFFTSSVSALRNKKISAPTDQFTAGFEQGLYDPDLTKPEGYEVPEIEEDVQNIDVPGGSQALDTNISDAVMLFTDQEKEEERKKLGTNVFGVDAQLNALGPFGSDVASITAEMPQRTGIGVSNVPAIAPYERGGSSTMTTGSIDDDELAPPPSGSIDFEKYKKTYDAGKELYYSFDNPSYNGENTTTTSPSSQYGAYSGAGVNLSTYTKPFSTGLGTTATQGSIGLSSAPPASLAGQGTGLTGAPYLGSATSSATPIGYGAGVGYGANLAGAGAGTASMGSVGYGATVGAGGGSAATAGSSWSGALKAGSQILQIYSIKQSFDSGTAEGKVSGTLQTAALLNPALAPYVALYEGIKMLTGWGGFGKWMRGGGYKHPMGGVEFRVTSQGILDKNKTETNTTGMPSDSDQTAWLNAGTPEFDEAVKNDTLRLTAPYSWGYNGYDPKHVKGQAQKQIDYLYAFADRYNVDVNEETFIKAATGSGGFEKYKPTGDRAPGTNHSLLERIDSVGNGSSTANQWLREVFEYVGPNGEKIVSGTPSSNNINVNTGLKDGFASQQDFENDITEFSTNFYS